MPIVKGKEFDYTKKAKLLLRLPEGKQPRRERRNELPISITANRY